MIAAVLAIAVPFFSQLTLESAQSAAVAHAPNVASAQAKVAEARANFDAARSADAPALVANYTESPQGVGFDETTAQRLTTVGAAIALGDVLAASPAIAEANASLHAAQYDLADAERTERITVIGYYYDALDTLAIARAREAAVIDAGAQLRAARVRFANGDAPRLDVVRAEVAYANAQSDLALARANAQNAASALAQETALDASALTTQTHDEPAPRLLPYDANAAVREALMLRPELASAQADVEAEEHAVAVARRGAFPQVTVMGGYTTGVDSAVKVSAPSANVSMNLPLGGAAHDRVAAEQARLAQAQARYETIRRGIVDEVGAAARTASAQGVALAAAQRALRAATAEYNATKIGYESGATSSLELESARSTYVGTLIDELSAYYARARAQAILHLLMGNDHA